MAQEMQNVESKTVKGVVELLKIDKEMIEYDEEEEDFK